MDTANILQELDSYKVVAVGLVLAFVVVPWAIRSAGLLRPDGGSTKAVSVRSYDYWADGAGTSAHHDSDHGRKYDPYATAKSVARNVRKG